MRSKRIAYFVGCLLYLGLSACSSPPTTATTAPMGLQLTLTATHSSFLTQVARQTPTVGGKLTPSTPTVSPLRKATPTPEIAQASATSNIRWKVNTIPVQRSIPPPIDAAGWETDQVAYLDSFDTGRWWIEATTGQDFDPASYPTSPAVETEPPPKWFSPNKEYVVECSPEAVQLYATANQRLISQSDLKVDCSDPQIVWAPTSSIVTLLARDDAYFWRTDGSAPRKLGLANSNLWVVWSPDGTRLLLISGLLPDSDNRSFDLVDTNGRSLLAKPVEIFWKIFHVEWRTKEVFSIYYGCGTLCSFEEYYDGYTGRLLTNTVKFGRDFQTAAPSPDGAWMVIDHQSDYDLFDLHTKQIFTLANSSNTYLRFSRWSPDSSTFYLVSRPTSRTAISNQKTPFGLLALNPRTKVFNVIFKQAMEVQWSPEQQLMWIVFPARQAEGSLGLAGGIFNPANTQLTGHEFISDQVLYTNPTEGSLVPAAWSNDGTRVVFGDSRGNLRLFNTNGTLQLLASNLPTEPWPKDVHYAWAPHDQNLLVQYGAQAWIVSVPNP
jgi:hypothetical protein